MNEGTRLNQLEERIIQELLRRLQMPQPTEEPPPTEEKGPITVEYTEIPQPQHVKVKKEKVKKEKPQVKKEKPKQEKVKKERSQKRARESENNEEKSQGTKAFEALKEKEFENLLRQLRAGQLNVIDEESRLFDMLKREQREYDRRVMHFYNDRSRYNRLDSHVAQLKKRQEGLVNGLKDYIKNSVDVYAELEACSKVMFDRDSRKDYRVYRQNKRVQRNANEEKTRAEDAEERSRIGNISARSLGSGYRVGGGMCLGGPESDSRDAIEDDQILRQQHPNEDLDQYDSTEDEGDEGDESEDSVATL